jgi:hypothetical protein
MKALSIAILAVGLMTAPAFADSIAGVQIAGAIGGPGGVHTVVIDGVTCKLKNSTFGQPQGCNYQLSGGISGQGQGKITPSTSNAGCSMSCQ